jgi:hypothetical protein
LVQLPPSAPQFWQEPPNSPQAVEAPPGWQFPEESQHPWHVAGPHPTGLMHVREPGSQLAAPSAAQFTQLWPGAPQATTETPGWQLPVESQHPLGHD